MGLATKVLPDDFLSLLSRTLAGNLKRWDDNKRGGGVFNRPNCIQFGVIGEPSNEVLRKKLEKEAAMMALVIEEENQIAESIKKVECWASQVNELSFEDCPAIEEIGPALKSAENSDDTGEENPKTNTSFDDKGESTDCTPPSGKTYASVKSLLRLRREREMLKKGLVDAASSHRSTNIAPRSTKEPNEISRSEGNDENIFKVPNALTRSDHM